MFPFLQQLFRLLDDFLSYHSQISISAPYLLSSSLPFLFRGGWSLLEGCSYSLLSRLGDVLVRFEEGTNVERLAAPEVSVDGPVERQFQRASI